MDRGPVEGYSGSYGTFGRRRRHRDQTGEEGSKGDSRREGGCRPTVRLGQ